MAAYEKVEIPIDDSRFGKGVGVIESFHFDEVRFWLDEAKSAKTEVDYIIASRMAFGAFVGALDDPAISERRELIQRELERKRKREKFDRMRLGLFDYTIGLGSRANTAIELGVRYFILVGPDLRYRNHQEINWPSPMKRVEFFEPCAGPRTGPVSRDIRSAPVIRVTGDLWALDLSRFLTAEQAAENFTTFAFADEGGIDD